MSSTSEDNGGMERLETLKPGDILDFTDAANLDDAETKLVAEYLPPHLQVDPYWLRRERLADVMRPKAVNGTIGNITAIVLADPARQLCEANRKYRNVLEDSTLNANLLGVLWIAELLSLSRKNMGVVATRAWVWPRNPRDATRNTWGEFARYVKKPVTFLKQEGVSGASLASDASAEQRAIMLAPDK